MVLTREENLLELARIKIDPLHFLKYVRIQEPGELSLEYKVWDHLPVFLSILDSEKYTILVKTKQSSASWTMAQRALRLIMTIPGFNVLEFSSGQTESQKLLDKSKIVYRNLPDWIRNIPEYAAPEPNSSDKFGFKAMGSVISAYPSTEKAGIGETAGWVIHDEAEFHDYFEVNLGHTMATVADNPVRRLTIVSTVDKTKPDSYFKTLFRGARGSGFPEAGNNPFRAIFWPYNVRPDRDEEWYQEQVRLNKETPWVVEANYPRTVEEALSPMSAQSCFSKERLDFLWENSTEPETKQNFIHILHPPVVGIPYVAGIDVGEGVGLDYSCLTIVGKYGMEAEVVAVIYSNNIATDLFAYESDKLCREYFNPLLKVENNAIGVAVINKLLELNYPNIYYGDDKKKKPGWNTGEKNKYTAMIQLIEVVNNGTLITRWKPQIKELMEQQWVNGKPIPTGKTHGDTVIPLMLVANELKTMGVKREASMYLRGRKIF